MLVGAFVMSMIRFNEKWDDRERAYWFRELGTRLKFNSFTWNAPNVGANSTVDTVLAIADAAQVDGLRVGMAIQVTPPATIDAGLIGWAWVATDNELTIRLVNTTGGGINPASGTWSFIGILV
jgi:hypothetical protein